MQLSNLELSRMKETLERLAGTRNRQARRQAAVLIADIEALLQIPEQLQAGPAAGSAPTKAEYDALVRDVDFLRARLFEVQTSLAARID